MALQDVPSRLEDILEAIDDIQRFVADKSFDEYQRDTMHRLAIERSVDINLEALRPVHGAMKVRHPTTLASLLHPDAA